MPAQVVALIIQTGLCGSMETASIGDCRYFLISFDEYIRKAFVNLRKAKDQQFMYFKELKSLEENQEIEIMALGFVIVNNRMIYPKYSLNKVHKLPNKMV